MLDKQVRPNGPVVVDGIARLDVDGIAHWLVTALGRYRDEPVKAIVPVAHGAGVAALSGDRLAFAPLDYEQPIPAETMATYRAQRDPFSVTGSPALPDGLNLGSQLSWLDQLYPQQMSHATLLPWAQYWAWFLSGVKRSEVTSLGCHSDLWDPVKGIFSPLALRRGWADRFALIARAGARIGTLRPDLAERTGLRSDVGIHTGLHDSNAALLAARAFPEMRDGEGTVLSTGTWFIAMRSPGILVEPTVLPDDCDCLVNVDVETRPVPSARFMGGREIATVVERDEGRIDIDEDQPALMAAAADVVSSGAALLPTLAPGCGPFPRHEARWIGAPQGPLHRRAAAALYAALVADASLDLIGSKERLLIEGRFARSAVFARSLAALRTDTRVFTAEADNDVSFGALRLLAPGLAPAGALQDAKPAELDLKAYRALWRSEVDRDASKLPA